ncbi:DUF6233 domain-containing protein [Streptomyces sp. NPDC058955]|uniref:DUF6233 domain-containing protein n=1 Tax=unclassified Streptomyces TaxID=2593676 RepID=UPI0036503F97
MTAQIPLPDDLPQLRTMERLAEILGAAVRARIAEIEARQAALRPQRTIPEGPTFVLGYLRERGRPVPDRVHLGDCSMAARHTDPLTRDQARGILAEGKVAACPFCRPETELGLD